MQVELHTKFNSLNKDNALLAGNSSVKNLRPKLRKKKIIGKNNKS